jgi:hypothetical protein
MDYYHLKSILAARKRQFHLRETSESFFIAGERTKPYIEPSFEKVLEFERERPTVILISAVGATGKTALARQLSRDTGLPIFDLSKHKPVGANTLTGLLTQAFDIKEISAVLEGLATGQYGIIIDAVDEGRSKATEEAFEAFLDDVLRLCPVGNGTTVIILGRTRTVDECWTYLSDRGLKPGLVAISPFNVDDARRYIDAFSEPNAAYARQYEEVRDFIIEKLGKAFTGNANEKNEEFLSFIGYPPVLDAISTLLREEQNYHKLRDNIAEEEASIVEVSLLYRIAAYVLRREREEKVLPIVQPLMQDFPDEIRLPALETAYSDEEQCVRLVAHCLQRSITLSRIPEPRLNEKYEEALLPFLPEHPFIIGQEFRNAVFEALALATLIASGKGESNALVKEYVALHKHSYHFVYMLDIISADHRVPINDLNALLLAALEFRSVHAKVELRINGPDPDDVSIDVEGPSEIDIEIEILLGDQQDASKTFSFQSEADTETTILLGPRLAGAFISVPCNVTLGGGREIEVAAPVELNARRVVLDAKSLILRPTKLNADEVILQCRKLESSLEKIVTNGANLLLAVEDMTSLGFPTIKYAQRISQPPSDPDLRQKYFRLRRILCEFRSHSRGTLARYKKKIEHERILKNEIGRSVLNKLLHDEILSLQGNHYILDPAGLNTHLGVTWPDLRKGQMPESLFNYLREID